MRTGSLDLQSQFFHLLGSYFFLFFFFAQATYQTRFIDFLVHFSDKKFQIFGLKKPLFRISLWWSFTGPRAPLIFAQTNLLQWLCGASKSHQARKYELLIDAGGQERLPRSC
jgi:hypothetical protein